MFRFPYRPAAALLSRSALRHNLKQIRAKLQVGGKLHSPKAKMMAVVKADSYGHQTDVFAPQLWKEGLRHFCVASLEEGVELRKILPHSDVLVLGGTLEWTGPAIELAKKHSLQLGVNSFSSLKRLSKEKSLELHIKFDTGMNRLGIKSEDWSEVFEFLAMRKVNLQGVYTHFAGFDGSSFERQAQLFEEIVRHMEALKLRPKWIHCENSGALFSPPPIKKGILAEKVNIARPGIAMYGYMPANFRSAHRLKPVLELRSELALIKRLEVGEGISYDHLYRARQAHEYGVVPLGYADGIAKDYSQALEPLWYDRQGKKKGRLKVCGAICMDMVMLRAKAGKMKAHDSVSFWGDFPNPLLRKGIADPYELNLRIAKRIPRVWVK